MATYNSDKYSATAQPPISSHGMSGNVKALFATVVCSSSPATTDTINFGYLPKNSRVIYALLESTDMDTNGTPLLALHVGDAGSANRYFAASAVGQAGTVAAATAVAGLGYLNTSQTLVTGVASTNAATGAAGTLYLTILYVVEESATS